MLERERERERGWFLAETIFIYLFLINILTQVIASNLSEEEVTGLKELFRSIDTDNSGTLTMEELKQGLAKQGTMLADYEVRQLMEAVSVVNYVLFTGGRVISQNICSI